MNVASACVGHGLNVDTFTPAETARGDPVGMAVDPGVPVTAYNLETIVPVGLFSLLI